jgi:hypothetical protein
MQKKSKIKVDLSEKCDCIVTFEIWYGRETEEFFYFEEIWRVKLSIWQVGIENIIDI